MLSLLIMREIQNSIGSSFPLCYRLYHNNFSIFPKQGACGAAFIVYSRQVARAWYCSRPNRRTNAHNVKQIVDVQIECDGRVAESEDSTTTTHTKLQYETTCTKGQPRVTRHHRKTYVDRTIMCNPFHHSGQFSCSILEQSTGLGRLNPQRRL